MRRPGPVEFEVYLIGVDAEKCESCGQCLDICPTGVFEMQEGRAVPIKPENCLYCRGCEGICPTLAITITEI
jgi:NAD-dependent dihydropyrimidine dehydrogenase PreA subunit